MDINTKFNLFYAYGVNALADKLASIPHRPIWSNPPYSVYNFLLKKLQIVQLDYTNVNDQKMARVITLTGQIFLGPVETDELNCSSRTMSRTRIFLNNTLSEQLLRCMSDSHIALIHNIVVRFLVEFSAYPYNAFRTSSLLPGDTFIDIGAFRGYVSLKAAWKVGSQGTVISIEPIQTNANFISAQASANNLQNIQLMEAALSLSNSKSINFYRNKAQENSQNPNHLSANSKKIEVDNLPVNSLMNCISSTTSKKVIISLTTNGTEIEIAEHIINLASKIQIDYLEISIPVLYTFKEVKETVKKFEANQCKTIYHYPWLKIIRHF